MTAIKPLSRIVDLWKKRSAAASDEYREGVTNPRKDWETETLAADENRKAGLEAADARDAWPTGVREAGTERWKERSRTVGPSRYRQGVKEAGDEFSSGFSRFHGVISNLTLPPRGPTGSPENHERSSAVGDALHAEKVGG